MNTTNKQQDDPVNHPSHYTDGKIEVIDFIEDKNLNFHRGNAVKYIAVCNSSGSRRRCIARICSFRSLHISLFSISSLI